MVDHNYPSMSVGDDKKITVRASAYGGCYRALVAEALGYVPDQVAGFMQEIFKSGHDREPIIVERLKSEYQLEFTDLQREINWEVIPGVIITGHLDGVVKYKKKDWVLEIKTASKESGEHFRKNGLKNPHIATYPWQVSIYYHALKLEMPELAGVLYAVQIKDKDAETDEIMVFEVTPIPYTVDEIASRAVVLQSYYNFNLADEEAPLPPCINSSWCQFKYLHDEREVVQDVDIARFVELNERKKEIEAELEPLKVVIIDRYKDDPRCENGFEASGYKFTISSVQSKKFDIYKALEVIVDQGLPTDDFYIPGKPYYRLTPTKVDKSKETIKKGK